MGQICENFAHENFLLYGIIHMCLRLFMVSLLRSDGDLQQFEGPSYWKLLEKNDIIKIMICMLADEGLCG